MSNNELPADMRQVAELVRKACVQAAMDGYERALGDGLCAEGAFEVAMDAIRDLPIDSLVRNATSHVIPHLQ